MKYLKLYEEFIDDDNDVLVSDPKIELSDKTIDDVLNDTFFDNEVTIDSKGIIRIKKWTQY